MSNSIDAFCKTVIKYNNEAIISEKLVISHWEFVRQEIALFNTRTFIIYISTTHASSIHVCLTLSSHD